VLLDLHKTSQSKAPLLRLGLLIDSPVLPRCFAEAIDHIQESNFARVALVIVNAEPAHAPAGSGPRSRWRTLARVLREPQYRQRFLFNLYERWDRRHVAADTDPLRPTDCSRLLAGVETMHVTPLTSRFVHRFPLDAIEKIRAANLDVLIRFGFNILRGEILTAAKFGVWSYHHGDNDEYRGGPAYFWEVYEANPLSGAILQVLTEQLDAGLVLCKGIFATSPGLSTAQNRVSPYWGASTFLIQKLHELHERGWNHVQASATSRTPYRGRKKIYRTPTNFELIRWIVPAASRRAVRRLRTRPDTAHWRIGIRRIGDNTDLPLFQGSPALDTFNWIAAPAGHFFADPFLVSEGDDHWVFFEDYDYRSRRGRISCARLTNGGHLSTITSALTRPYHLSYPCVFRDGDELYMIPESWDNGTVELYRCRRFPDDWQLERTLLSAPAVDSTIWIDQGVYWMWVTAINPRGYGAQLWLFHAESLGGEWMPHPASPISTDIRVSRGAGAVFRHDGRLIRPSQDCSESYGRSFTLNEIVALDKRSYQERPLVTITPPRGFAGTHTYNRLGPIEVIDACTMVRQVNVMGDARVQTPHTAMTRADGEVA
jgi:hypothetical protein